MYKGEGEGEGEGVERRMADSGRADGGELLTGSVYNRVVFHFARNKRSDITRRSRRRLQLVLRCG